MKTEKMSLANIQGKLSRTEMRNIMAGSGKNCPKCTKQSDCPNSSCVSWSTGGPCGYGSYCI